MPTELYKVAGDTNRLDVWWQDEHCKYVSCPKCGYIATYHGDEHRCSGCGKRTDIVLKD